MFGGLKNKVELSAVFNTKINDNSNKEVSQADIRDCFNDIVNSFEPNTVALVGTGVEFDVTDTPSKFNDFNVSGGTMISGIMSATNSDDQFEFHHGCSILFTLVFNGQWTNNETLTVEVRKNGLPSTFLQVTIDGEGGGKPVSLSATGVIFGVDGDLVEVYMTGESSFTVTQLGIQMVAEYLPLSVAT